MPLLLTQDTTFNSF